MKMKNQGPCQTSNTCLPVYLLPLYRQAPPLSSSVLHSTTRSEVGTVRKCLTEVNINPTIRVIILIRYINAGIADKRSVYF